MFAHVQSGRGRYAPSCACHGYGGKSAIVCMFGCDVSICHCRRMPMPIRKLSWISFSWILSCILIFYNFQAIEVCSSWSASLGKTTARMYNSNVLLSAALLLSTCSAAPIEQLPLEKHEAARYPFRNDPYDRKHDTYGDGVQPLPVVSPVESNMKLSITRLTYLSAMAMAPVC
jgi:hypothetical protein